MIRNGKKLYTVLESLKQLELSLSHVYYYINALNIKKIKYNGKIYLTTEDIKQIKLHKVRQSKTQISMLKNKTISKNNKTGIRGVFYNSRIEKYWAIIDIKKERHFLGQFNNLEDAKKARLKGEKRFFKPVLEKWKENKKNKLTLIGSKFGKLIVIEKINNKYGCLCDCGKIIYVNSSNLKNGTVKSCGCYKLRNS